MRAFLGDTTRETVLGGHFEVWHAHIRNLDARIEQLAAEIDTLKANLTN